jgi:hypothetical protein
MSRKGWLKEKQKELNDRLSDHNLTYHEVYEVLGLIDDDNRCMTLNPQLDRILYYNPELDNGSYI